MPEISNSKIFDALYTIAQSTNKSLDAVILVSSAKGKANTSKKIIENVIKIACKRYNKEAMKKLNEMGIRSGKDIGAIVYKMVELGLLIEENGDSMQQFELLFNDNDKRKLFSKFQKIKVFIGLINSIFLVLYSGMMIYIINSNENSILVLIFWFLSILYTLYLFINKRNA